MRPSIFFTLLLFLTSCSFFKEAPDKEQNNRQENLKEETETSLDTKSFEKSGEEVASVSRPAFVLSGTAAKSFLPRGYLIDMEAEGDLNGDGLLDKALVVLPADDSTAERASLILLQLGDRTYKLAHFSWTAVVQKYTGDGLPIYGNQEISIDSAGILRFSMYDPGPSGNLESRYQYKQGVLVLISLETYSMGAGSHSQMECNLADSIVEYTEFNTMNETSETKKYLFERPKILFENADPEAVARAAYKALEE